MSKNKNNHSAPADPAAGHKQDEKPENGRSSGFSLKTVSGFARRNVWTLLTIGVVSFGVFGVMARNGWFPSTDPLTGQKTGWFGAKLAKNASSSWNPFAGASPTPTPQLSKEYIYAGSRLLAVEDAGANAAPPADLAVWRQSSGTWYVLGGPNSSPVTQTWGQAGDIPVQGDYDGDGKTDFSVWRPSTGVWYVIRSSDFNFTTQTWGVTGDTPVPGDFDGDGKTDKVIFRPSNYTWYIIKSSDNTLISYQYGASTDIPYMADYDGDGRADPSLFRPSNNTFYTTLTATWTLENIVMSSTGVPVSADYDGDGKANYAIKDGNDWIIMNAAKTSESTVTFQNATDIPVQNDYDGDGIVDIAVWRDSNATWYIRQSSLIGQTGELRTEAFGQPGDIPVPAFYRR